MSKMVFRAGRQPLDCARLDAAFPFATGLTLKVTVAPQSNPARLAYARRIPRGRPSVLRKAKAESSLRSPKPRGTHAPLSSGGEPAFGLTLNHDPRTGTADFRAVLRLVGEALCRAGNPQALSLGTMPHLRGNFAASLARRFPAQKSAVNDRGPASQRSDMPFTKGSQLCRRGRLRFLPRHPSLYPAANPFTIPPTPTHP